MFEEFSRGYYFGRLYVEPHEGDQAIMQREEHERANKQVYATGEGLERLDHPLVMKVEDTHFPVHGDDAVPSRTLAVPDHLIQGTRIDDPPTITEVLLAKAEWAGQLLSWFGVEHRSGDPDGNASLN